MSFIEFMHAHVEVVAVVIICAVWATERTVKAIVNRNRQDD